MLQTLCWWVRMCVCVLFVYIGLRLTPAAYVFVTAAMCTLSLVEVLLRRCVLRFWAVRSC